MKHAEAQALANTIAQEVITYREVFIWGEDRQRHVVYGHGRERGSIEIKTDKHPSRTLLPFERNVRERFQTRTPEEIGAILFISRSENGGRDDTVLYPTIAWDVMDHHLPEPQNFDTIPVYVLRLATYTVMARMWDLLDKAWQQQHAAKATAAPLSTT